MASSYLGEYPLTLDPKGRVFLPPRYRSDLEHGCFIVKGQERCLYLFSAEGWSRFNEALKVHLSSKLSRDFTRMLYAGASEQSPDKQGRVVIPEPLRRYAGLERDVAILGAGSRLEIWDRQVWETRRQAQEEQYAELDLPAEDFSF